MVRVIVLFIVVAGLASAGSLARADFAAGEAAYERSDYPTAMKELLRSAENGNPKAQFMVAKMYEHGQGVKKDAGQAMVWHLKAARQGHAPAMYRVGRSVVWYLRMDPGQIEADVIDILLKDSKFNLSKSKEKRLDVRRYISSHRILVASALIAAAGQGDETAKRDKNNVLSKLSEIELSSAVAKAQSLKDGEAWLRAIFD